MPYPSDTTPDTELFDLIDDETQRQVTGLQLIASENFTSPAVMRAVGSVLTNKYSEGYPGKRYYGGNAVIDSVEALAIERVKQLFGADHANVQPHSGANANMDARYGKIRGDHQTADETRAAARAEVAEYEAELATVKAEARQRIDVARQTLEGERTTALAAANERISARRAEAIAATEAARAAAAQHIEEAVADVSSRAAELATGRRPDPAAVSGIVSSLMAGGGGQ